MKSETELNIFKMRRKTLQRIIEIIQIQADPDTIRGMALAELSVMLGEFNKTKYPVIEIVD